MYHKRYILLTLSWFGFLVLFSGGAYLIQKHFPQRPFMMMMNPADTLRNASSFPRNNIFPSRQIMKPGLSLFFGFFPFLTMLGLSTTFRLVSDKVRDERLSKEKENEGLKTELSFLRSQTSPHFLFNVMNSMVAMARLKSNQLEPSLIQLGGLLRYMLYNTDESKVKLADEISFLQSYIDLQKLRFGDNIHINFHSSNDESVPVIEPMLLIPFVENAFKHGAGLIMDPEIKVDMNIKNGKLLFSVQNKYDEQTGEKKDDASGIGLVNVSRRLDLLYGENHSLTIDKTDHWFRVLLTLNFTDNHA